MENYCIKEEVDKQWKDEDYLKIAEKQHARLGKRNKEYTEFICWVMNHINEDLNIYTQEDYENENYDNVIPCVGNEIYDKLGIDILELEECFIEAYLENKWTNSIKLVVRVNYEEIGYIIDVM